MNTLISLSAAHYIYLIGVICILTTMAFRKDTLLPCIFFIFLIGCFSLGNVVAGIQAVFNAIVFSGISFMDIIGTISLVSALSCLLKDIGSDYLIMNPLAKYMKNPLITFWVLGLTMFICSLFLWPSPAVALIGAVLVPIAVGNGLPALVAAVSMNIFGHGIALGYDFVIQGAPNITASAAGISTDSIIIGGRPLFITMSVVTAIAAFIACKKDITNKNYISGTTDFETKITKKETSKAAKTVAIIAPVCFLLDIILMFIFKLKGSDATSLVSGTAVIIMVVGAFLEFKIDSLEKITDYIRDGFGFGIKIFAPIIIIGAFFFMGGDGIGSILGDSYNGSQGIMNDWAMWLSSVVPLSKYPIAFIQLLIGAITGLDGSGFSGLPLVGSLAATFGNALNIDIGILATLGQISAIWVGGGTIIPWAIIPVAAICNVDPLELARKNFLPVMIGFGATLTVAMILL